MVTGQDFSALFHRSSIAIMD